MVKAPIARLQALAEQGRLRQRRPVTRGPRGIDLRLDGRPLVSFASNDYLGLANSTEISTALSDGARRYGGGSGSASLLAGYSDAHAQAETVLADYVGAERALLFSSGYLANLGWPALFDRSSRVVADKYVHASIIDGLRLAGVTLSRFPHADLTACQRTVQRADTAAVVTESVFSMDGDTTDLPALAAISSSANALLVVDEAHALGWAGVGGRGLASQLPSRENLLLVATLGKSFGLSGAFVAGPQDWIEWLVNRARSYLFNTAMPPALAQAIADTTALVEAADDRRQRLTDNMQTMQQACDRCGLMVGDVNSPIVPVIVGDDDASVKLSHWLETRGFFVPAIRPPTVPAGSARLRLSLTAEHTAAEIDDLIGAVAEALHG